MATSPSLAAAASQNQPLQSEEAGLPFAANAQSADQWLQQLNGLGFGDACRALYSALRVLNRTSLAPHQRLAVLETLRPSVLDYTGRLDGYFLGQPFPLESKIVKVARLAMQFQSETARGYHIVAAAPIFGRVLGRPQQAVVLHRAMDAYGKLQLLAAQCYEPLPSNYWKNLYRLFQQAEDLDLADAQADDAESAMGDGSARELLRQIALFHTAVPTRLAQWQIGELHAFFKANGHLSRLERPESLPAKAAHYCLDLRSSQPPMLSDPSAEPPADALYLSLEPLLVSLLASGAGCSSIGPAVAKRLQPGFDIAPGASGRQVVFTQGAEACAALLDTGAEVVWQRLEAGLQVGRRRIEVMPRHTPLAPQLDVVDELKIGRDDIWSDYSPEAIAVEHAAFGVVYQAEDRAVLIAERRKLRIGDLILLAAPQQAPLLGIVRNLASTSDPARARASLDLVPGKLSSARAYVEGEQRRRLPAILVAESLNQASLHHLLMPYAFQNGTWVTLEQHGRWRNQRLARLSESTASFSQYQLVPPPEA